MRNKKEKGKDDTKQQANLIEKSQNEDFLFIISKFKHGWIVDSSATSHVTSNKSMFTEFNEHHQEKIFVANGQRVAVEGIGTVQIHVVNHDGKRRLIKIQEVFMYHQLVEICCQFVNLWQMGLMSILYPMEIVTSHIEIFK